MSDPSSTDPGPNPPGKSPGDAGWYDLFSRGARDWLRHNDKVRAAVRDKLPELIAGSELLPNADRTVQVPVRFLEHARLRLRDADETEGVGQGAGKPGDQLAQPSDGATSKGEGGNEEGGYQFILELKIDDIVDWLWEELKLPNLKVSHSTPRPAMATEVHCTPSRRSRRNTVPMTTLSSGLMK